MRKLTLENVKRELSSISPTIEILDTEYINSKHKMRCLCKVCESTWSIRWNDLRKGVRCPNCKIEKLREINTIIDRDYVNKSLCDEKLTISAISDVYKLSGDSKYKIDCACLTCGHKWTPNLNNLLNKKSGCPECSQSNKGWNRTSWVQSAMASRRFDSFKVYLIRCHNKDETFYKIGRTFLKTKLRFCSFESMPYKYDVIKTICSDDGEYIYDLENGLHKIYKDFKYEPKISFHGETECFTNVPNFDESVEIFNRQYIEEKKGVI